MKNGIRDRHAYAFLRNTCDSGIFYSGWLHHEGGVVFFLIGLVLLFPVFWLLQRSEGRSGTLADAGTI